MSEENVEVVQQVYDAVARRDRDAVLALYHPDVEWDYSRGTFADMIGRRVYRGHTGLHRFFRELYEAWENLDFEGEELIDAGDQVISVVVNRGRGRASGVEVESRNAGVWTIRDGKIVRVAWFSTRQEALEAAGLSE